MARPVLLFEESALSSTSVVGRDSEAQLDAARAAGFDVASFSSDLLLFGDVEDAFEPISPRPVETRCLWVGFIPTLERYGQVYEAAARRNLRLPNGPEAHAEAMEFDRFYPRLEGLTPRSVVLTGPEGCGEAVSELGLPLFVKGALQSLKGKGPSACMATSVEELEHLVSALLGHHLARGRVIVRELVPLRFTRRSESGMPMGREFRAFLYANKLVSLGYYWHGDDELMTLSPDERATVSALCEQAARRLSATFVAVDVGQRDDGGWTVIEVGDGQFAGTGHVELAGHFAALFAAMS